jgi:uncharacterized lipoprotein YmbA
MVEQLRVRLEASLAKLHSGQVTGSGTEEVSVEHMQISTAKSHFNCSTKSC